MKKGAISLLLMLLLLLCACSSSAPDRESPGDEAAPVQTPAPDPRVLWQEAEAALDTLDNLDMDSAADITMDINGITSVFINESRVRGCGLQGDAPIYQIVTTGDSGRECYYSDGWLYVSQSCGNFKMEADDAAFAEYMSRDSISIAPVSFNDVTLVSAENGYKLAFSLPNEDFCRSFGESFSSEGMELKEGSLEVMGAVTLLEDGSLHSCEADITCVLLVEDQEVGVTMHSKDTVLPWNDTEIILPAKLEQFLETDNIEAVEQLYDVLLELSYVTAADFTTDVSFDGHISGVQTTGGQKVRGWFDLASEEDALYYREWTVYKNDMELSKDIYTQDLDSTTHQYKSYVSEEESDAMMLLLAVEDNFFSNCTVDMVAQYLNPVIETTDEGVAIRFGLTDEKCSELLDTTMYVLMDDNSFEKYATDISYDCKSNSGCILLDENGAIRSLELSATISSASVKGPQVLGTVTFRRDFHALDDAVVFPEAFNTESEISGV